MNRRHRIGALAALALASASAANLAQAQSQGPQATETSGVLKTMAEKPGPCSTTSAAQEAKDQAVLKSLEDSFTRGGDFPTIERHRAALEDALSHAPASMSPLELCGDVLIVRSSGLLPLLHASAIMKEGGAPGAKSAEQIPSPYPRIALYLGAADNEREQWAAAVAHLSKGLALDPYDPKLATEDSLALTRLGRFAEALAVVDKVLAGDGELSGRDHARLLRTRGFALGELRRFDEAEAAYRESLRFEPNNPTALNELKYIDQQRKGAPKAPVAMTTSKSEQ